MDSTTFWLILIRWVTIAIMSLIACASGCTINADYLISLDIKNGARPLAAYCAHSNNTDRAVCAIEASK